MVTPAPIPSKRAIGILLVDDHALIRKTVRSILEQEPNFLVCDEASDGGEAVRIARETHPDVVIMDAEMPALNGFTAAKQIRAGSPETSVVMLSSHKGSPFVNFAHEAGLQGYVSKGEAAASLVKSVKHAAASKNFFQA